MLYALPSDGMRYFAFAFRRPRRAADTGLMDASYAFLRHADAHCRLRDAAAAMPLR